MKNKLLLLFILLLSSCTEFEPEDLIFTKELFYTKPKAILTSEDIEKDIDLLIYAFRTGYAARYYLDKKLVKDTLKKLVALKNNYFLSEKDFCDRIGTILWDIPDGHLSVRSRGKYCGAQKYWSERKGNVGTNFGKSHFNQTGIPWKIEYKKVDGKNVGMISIASFPSHKDKVWKGYSEAIKKLMLQDKIIVDLRGNGGGDDTTGFQLAELLQDRKLKPGWHETIVSQSPETFALLQNNLIIRKLNSEYRKTKVPDYVIENLKFFQEQMEKAKSGKVRAEKVYKHYEFEYPYGPNHFKGSLYILVDNLCGSSCESSMEILSKHPRAKIVGEQTAGKYHFGNVATLILPISKISIVLASKYNKYRDGKNIDKKGFFPNIKVPAGKNALEYALND
ncbi:MAG: hypothetical protein GY909_06630 [Oligoflexia bacterium]|nr:hypothetical protein [Oligoflexia bacterium]